MWLAWSKPVEIYLGRTFSLCQVPGKDKAESHHTPTGSVAQSLAQMDTAKLRGRRVHVTLSCALCPALGFEVPAGIEKWREQREIARAWAMRESATKGDDLLCEIDSRQLGIGAVLEAKTQSELSSWAKSVDVHVMAITPLWAHASMWREARKPTVNAILVQEPDGITVIASAGNRAFRTATLVNSGEERDLQIRLRQSVVSLGVSSDQLARIAFGATTGPQLAGGPIVLASHWRAA